MKRILFAVSALLVAVYFFGGSCDRVKGPERRNQPPKVYFVNIPVENAKFSSDTTLYWYGTDVDGFIDFFRYAVVEGSNVTDSGGPESFLAKTSDDSIGWVAVDVTPSNPGTSDRVNMSADIRDPVRKYLTSYIFLQAVDNLGAKSQIIYRTFLKNNHFPNTKIDIRDVTDPYVNVYSELSGVNISWYGVDSADYLDPPPFYYKWKLFGPYTDEEMEFISNNFVTNVFLDIYGDIYFDDDSYPIDDTTAVPVLQVGRVHGSWEHIIFLDTIIDTIPPRLRTFLPIPDTLIRLVDSSGMPMPETYRSPTPEWSTELRHILANVYHDSPFPMDTTSQYNFLLWCQCRDDSKVKDAVPAFGWISVIDPKFEREVVVLDMTRYEQAGAAGVWNFPQFVHSASTYWPSGTPAIAKLTIGNMVNEWGRQSLGKDSIFDLGVMENKVIEYPDGSSCKLHFEDCVASQDYYPIRHIRSTWTSGTCSEPYEVISLREILKHKIIILFKDDTQNSLDLTGVGDLPELISMIDGMNAGMSCWSMARDAFGSIPDPEIPGFSRYLGAAYRGYFGVLRIWIEAWAAGIKDLDPEDGGDNRVLRNENFIGAVAADDFKGAFPALMIDTTLLEQRYYWTDPMYGIDLILYPFRLCSCTPGAQGEMIKGALPEVGFVERTPSPLVKAIYLYKSCYRPKGDTTEEYKYLRGVDDMEQRISGCCAPCWQCTTFFTGVREAYKCKTVGLYTDASPFFKSSHFSFTFVAIDSVAAKQAFLSMMDSLASGQLIRQTGKMAAHGRSGKRNRHVNVAELRRITEELHDLKAEAIEEWKRSHSNE